MPIVSIIKKLKHIIIGKDINNFKPSLKSDFFSAEGLSELGILVVSSDKVLEKAQTMKPKMIIS